MRWLPASRHNATNAGAHELFARCAKSLLLSGPASAKQSDRKLGFTLELVAEKNPYLLHAGDELPVRLTYENRPLAGALVIAMNRLNPAEKAGSTVRQRWTGTISICGRAGMWLIKAVHMIPAPAGSNAEWASFWASLTFEMRNPEGKSDDESELGKRPRMLDVVRYLRAGCRVTPARPRDRDIACRRPASRRPDLPH